MASIAQQRAPALSGVGGARLAWAFVERQTNLWKRYWAWEVVWLVYGVVNTLAITFIAKQVGNTGSVSKTRGLAPGAVPAHRHADLGLPLGGAR